MNNRFSALALALSISASGAFAAVDPQLLALSLPDAKILAGVQITQSKNSPFGQYLLTQAAVTAPQLDQIKTLTGFDPRTDLSEIVVSSTAADGKGLIVGRGIFQPSRISNLASAAGTAMTVYHGIYVITAPPSAGQSPLGAVAFLDASTIVAGDKTQVEGAIDRWVAGGTATGALADEAVKSSSSTHAWMVASNLTQLLPAAPTGNNQAVAIQGMMSTISQISGSVTFGDTQITVHGKAQTRTAQDAQSMADGLRFLVGMAMSQSGAPAISTPPTFTANGASVEVTASLSETQAEQLFQVRPAVHKATLRQASIRK
jgi:hypothetical protein